MKKSTKLTTTQNINCLNCGFPFSGQENFCPECGQKNKGSELTFGSFVTEIFNGFISWDAKFWTTIIPLLTKPGKVSLDYINGKRNRYSNPFRFYLTVSVIFFLIIGFSSKYSDLKKLRTGSSTTKKIVTIDNKEIPTDSISNFILSEIKNAKINKNIPVDSITKLVTKEITDAKTQQDSLQKKEKKKRKKFFDFSEKLNETTQLTIAGFDLSPFMKFQKKHPEMPIDEALDSLKHKKTFKNRFWYKRSEAINSVISKNGGWKKVVKEIVGDVSIALFILLPLFTLFLKLIYFRHKKTYVAHLVFVFHTQTVFFLLLSLFFIVNLIKGSNGDYFGVFLLSFLLYLFLAMKTFYKQDYFKTSVKFMMANMSFLFLSFFGGVIISMIALLVF